MFAAHLCKKTSIIELVYFVIPEVKTNVGTRAAQTRWNSLIVCVKVYRKYNNIPTSSEDLPVCTRLSSLAPRLTVGDLKL